MCGKGEGRGKGLKGACVGGCSPSLWSSPAAVGCSLPCFYKKLLFRVDLLDSFCRYDPSLRCLSLGLAGSSISGAGGRWIHCFLYFSFWCSNLQSPIKAKKNKIPPGQNRVRAATPTRGLPRAALSKPNITTIITLTMPSTLLVLTASYWNHSLLLSPCTSPHNQD